MREAISGNPDEVLNREGMREAISGNPGEVLNREGMREADRGQPRCSIQRTDNTCISKYLLKCNMYMFTQNK